MLHLLVAGLRRFAERTFDGGPSKVLDRLLHLLAEAFEKADAMVANAIAVSFVEDSCPWERTHHDRAHTTDHHPYPHTKSHLAIIDGSSTPHGM